MDRIIRTLKEMKEKHEKAFIENSIIVKQSRPNSLIPNAQDDLDMIIELGNAISFLENKPKSVESVAPKMSHLVGVLKYAIEETGRISGDHDGTAGVKSPNDNYSLIARDYVENKTDFIFPTKFVSAEVSKEDMFEEMATDIFNIVNGRTSETPIKKVREYLSAEFEKMKK